MNTGLIPNLPFDEYLKLDLLSNSGVSKMLRSPAHYMYEEDEPSPSQNVGKLVHKLILEPDDFAREYKVADIDRRTKEGKSIAADADKNGVTVISTKDYAKACHMYESVMKHANASGLLSGGQSEVTAIANVSGVGMKGRIDKLHLDSRIVVDLKSTQDASHPAFSRSVVNYAYNRQAALYLDLLEILTSKPFRFILVAVETAAPYATAVYELTNELIDIGRNTYRSVLPIYKMCKEMNEWPAYDDEIKLITAPSWLKQ